MKIWLNNSHLSLLATNLFSTDAMPAVMPNLNQYCLNMILRPFSATVVKPGKSLLEITALKAQEDSQQQVLLNAVHSKIQNKAYINNIQKHYSLLWVMNV